MVLKSAKLYGAGRCKSRRFNCYRKSHTQQYLCGRAFRHGKSSCAAKYRKLHQWAVWWHRGFFGWGHVPQQLGKDGGFASKVIGSIATGQTGGSITGDSAVEALNGYFAGTSDAEAMPVPATSESIPPAMAMAENDTVTDSPVPATPLALEGDSTVDVSPTRDSEIAMRAGGSSAITEQSTIPTSSSIQQAAMNRVLLGQMGNSVTDVEIGGGKIQGREIIPGRGQIQFAMYNARQYEKPDGHFAEQTSRDGEKWYKVYATTRVEKTPTVQDERGRMQYDERKVAAMPKAPARRH